MIQILLTIVAPVFVIAGLGDLLDQTKTLEVRTLSRVVIYLASPCLAFYGIANTTITGRELSGLVLIFLLTN